MIYVLLGTQAQLIKMAPIMLQMQERKIAYRFIFTGQYQETMQELRNNFSLPNPDVTLYSGPEIETVGSMIRWAIRIFISSLWNHKRIFPQKSGILLIHGDTVSTLIGALLGRILGLELVQVEAGLRSFHIFHPFPEEIIRLIISSVSHQYFAAGSWALQNLTAYRGKKFNTVHNTLVDSVSHVQCISTQTLNIQFPKERYCIVSMHRFENLRTIEIVEKILSLIEQVAQVFPVMFIWHPLTRDKLMQYGLAARIQNNPRIQIHPRYDFVRFIKLLEGAEFLVTDGGSNQEECFYMGKPCLLLRKATERQEGLGENVVLSRFEPSIVDTFLHDYVQHRRPPIQVKVSPSAMIVDAIAAYA